MGIHEKDKLLRLKKELVIRHDRLSYALEHSELTSDKQGLRKDKRWPFPERMGNIDSTDVQLAVDDFKAILSQLRKL